MRVIESLNFAGADPMGVVLFSLLLRMASRLMETTEVRLLYLSAGDHSVALGGMQEKQRFGKDWRCGGHNFWVLPTVTP